MSDTNSKPTQAQALHAIERLRGAEPRQHLETLRRFIDGCADAAPAAPSRAPDAAPAGRRCHSYECRAAQRDSVLCADGRCDIEEGVRRGPDSAPAGVAADESTRAPDGWIAVSDRLPEPNAAVLVAGEFDRPGDWRIKAAFYEPTCGDVIVRMNGGWRVIGGSWKPSHWRPMPAPPSGERPSAPAPRKPTDDELRTWIERHNLGSMGITEARGIFEDAQTLHLDGAPAPEGEQR